MLHDSIIVVVVINVATVVRTHPRAIPLAMITMRKSTHGFPFLSYMSIRLRLAPFGPLELRSQYLVLKRFIHQILSNPQICLYLCPTTNTK